MLNMFSYHAISSRIMKKNLGTTPLKAQILVIISYEPRRVILGLVIYAVSVTSDQRAQNAQSDPKLFNSVRLLVKMVMFFYQADIVALDPTTHYAQADLRLQWPHMS